MPPGCCRRRCCRCSSVSWRPGRSATFAMRRGLMTPRSPIIAMLWELWRVTRTEVAWKLALPIGGGLAALTLGAAFAPPDNPKAYKDVNDNVAAFALILIVMPHLAGSLSMGKLNGGQPGFPLSLLYTRPVRTA